MEDVREPLEECLRAFAGLPPCRGLWRRFTARETAEGLDLGFTRTESRSLRAFLWGRTEIVLLAMTAGLETDRRIARCALRSPLQGLLAHAAGAERVESACDAFCADLGRLNPGLVYAGRFSPGYGDLPLSTQRAVFAALNCEKTLGLHLGEDTLLMTPSKSVTAIAVLRPEGEEGEEHENH